MKNNLILIVKYFLVWRASLFIISFISVLVIPQFGNSFPYFDDVLIPTGLPSWIWGFGNFDGVHYLKIAIKGYEEYNQAFFPLYPILINFFSFGESYFFSGFLISNIFFLTGLYFFYKLLRLDFDHYISKRTLIFLLAFPTSFYFGSIYSESLFLLLVVTSIYFLRTRNFLLAGILASLATATRFVGVLLIPLFIIEVFLYLKSEKKEFSWSRIMAVVSVSIIPIGIMSYMSYLNIFFNNPFYFFTSQSAFGASRSTDTVILLPQVVIRYIKILTTVPLNSLSFLNASLELLFTLTCLSLLVISFKKVRLSYWFFSAGCFILPTLTGTFSSMPRYILMTFLLLPFLVSKFGYTFYYWLIPLIILQIVLLSMFIRGYWVA